MREALNPVEGVSDIKTDTKTHEATVTYDPAKTKPEVLAKILTDYKGAHDFTAEVKQS